MTTQVIFNIDKKLKQQAMKKAQADGIAFSSVLKSATKAYVNNELNMELVKTPKFNRKTAKELEQALKDIKAGKNLSPKFNNVEDAMTYLLS